MQTVINIDDNLYTRLFDNGDECVEDMRKVYVAIRNGTPLPNNATNGDMIKVMFPNIITEEFAITMHASTKVTCCGDKHCKGAISYDFWKEWWNAPYI